MNSLRKRRANKLLTVRNNLYKEEGPVVVDTDMINSSVSHAFGEAPKVNTAYKLAPAYSQQGPQVSTQGTDDAGKIFPIAAAAAKIGQDVAGTIQYAMADDVKDQAKSMIETANSQQAKAQEANDSFDQLMSDWGNNSTIKHISKKDLGYKNFGQGLVENLSTGNVLQSTLGNALRNKVIRRETDKVNAAIDYANKFNTLSLQNRASNLSADQMNNALANYAAHGGPLATHGGVFSNGLTYIGEGGTHEQNPYEGIQVGVDQQGTPDLVEEGEVLFNDYVYSKRNIVPKSMRKELGLGGYKNLTFADAALQKGKESEERPNDPISQRGLIDSMSKLAFAQEIYRQNMNSTNYAANGGKLFWKGGYKYYGQDPEDTMQFMTNGKYTDDYRAYVGNISESDMAANYHVLQQYYNNATDEQKKTKRYKNIKAYFDANPELKTYDFSQGTLPEGLYEFTKDGGLDGAIGGRHYGIMSPEQRTALFGERRKEQRRFLLGPETDANGTPLDPYKDATEILDKDYNPEEKTYSYVDKRTSSKGDIDYTDLYYRKAEEEAKKDIVRRFYAQQGADGEYEELTGDNPSLLANNNANLSKVAREVTNPDGSISYYYDWDPKQAYKKLPTWPRYAGLAGQIGFGITDALGWTNKPNYTFADNIANAAKTASTFEPVQFEGISNYLPYTPFDRDYYLTKLMAESSATRRNIMNTSAGNGANAMAGLLANSYNTQTKIGDLGRQAQEYDWNLLKDSETFNRDTNMFNATGKKDVALANQSAKANARNTYLEGIMASEKMKHDDYLTSEQNKADNISGAFESFSNIGKENMAWNWRNLGLATNTFGNVGDDTAYLLTNTGRRRTKVAKGGKINRKRKGFTV